MTIGEAIYRLWENAGEPTDLDPWILDPVNFDPETELDPNSTGVRWFLRALSDAQIELANWKTNRGRPIRFKDFLVSRNVRLTPSNTIYSITVLNPTTIRITAPPSWMTLDTLESARCTITQTYLNIEGVETSLEETLMVMSVVREATSAYIDIYFREELTEQTTLVSAEAQFNFDRFQISRADFEIDTPYLLMPESFKNILKVTDSENSSSLTRAASRTHLYNPDMTTGTPTEWYAIGRKIYFDVYFEEPRWFHIEYQKIPDVLTSIDQEFEIPPAWHEVLIEMAEYLLAKRARENDLTAIKFNNINRLIAHMRNDHEDDWLRDPIGSLKIRME